MRWETVASYDGVKAWTLLAAVLLFAGCGEERAPSGDAGGVPVTFAVELVYGYVSEMSSERWDGPPPFPRPFFGGPGFRHRNAYGPFGYDDPYYFDTPTQIQLIAGDGPAEANLFRVSLHHGANVFTVPVRAGRTVTMTVMVRGGREGWEGVGHFTVQDRPQVAHLRLAPEGPALIVTVDAPTVGSATVGGTAGTGASATAGAPVQ